MATILVVDDEQMICDLLGALLTGKGHQVMKATSGQEALALFRLHHPQITLLDLKMPGMHGMTVLKEIRAIDPRAAVMILTSETKEPYEEQARQLGVTEFLQKGLSLEALLKAVERVMSPSVSESAMKPAAPEQTAQAPQPDSILIVDDEATICHLLSHYLTLRGYRVRTAQNGVEAMRQVKQEHPRLIILDMFMPGVSGVDVLRELKAAQYKGRVITLTGSQDEKLLQEACDLGSVDIMGKPVDLIRLALKVRATLTP
jgi:DNA-binding response OmpR family regulator